MDTEVNTGIKCYPAGIAREMEKLIAAIASQDPRWVHNTHHYEKAIQLMSELNG